MEAQIQQEEEEEACQEGHVQAKVYFGYGRAAGWALVAVLAVSFVLMQVTPSAPGMHALCLTEALLICDKLHSTRFLLSALLLSWISEFVLIEIGIRFGVCHTCYGPAKCTRSERWRLLSQNLEALTLWVAEYAGHAEWQRPVAVVLGVP